MTAPTTADSGAAPSPARTSIVAAIANRISLFGLASAILGIMAVQAGIVSPLVAFMMFVAGALLGGLIGTVLGLVGLVLTRGGQDPTGRKNALIGLGLGAGLMGLVFVGSMPGRGLPPINDITTDLANPPQFATGPNGPGYDGRDMSYPPEFVAQVEAAYPDLGPIELSMKPAEAMTLATSTAERLGWKITYRDRATGTFDAEDESALFRFVDDVAVRVEPEAEGSRIDVRSKSRDGRGDLGANAARIRRFETALTAAARGGGA